MRAIPASSFRSTITKSSALYRTALAAAMLSASFSSAWANPEGGTVTGGSATINGQGTGSVVVNQYTDHAVIDWTSFNINNGESTHFNQPGSNSVALNRIHDQNPSLIFGSLTANGKLVLVNPNGVFFGAGSRVDVSGLVASTADMSNHDFMRGSTNFNIAGRPDASIINKGTITAAEGGLVALVAPSVRNDGVIQARSGAIRIGAADTFTVDFYGDNLYSFAVGQKTTKAGKDENGMAMDSAIENNGTLSANGGSILLTANAAKDVVTNAVNNKGIIEAKSARSVNGVIILDGGEGNVRVAGKVDASGKGAGEKGGKITVTGKNIELRNATVDASGTNGGGEVKIGGDYQGGGTLAHADSVWVDGNSLIDVSALEYGNGGTAVLWSDGVTQFDGTILATGGSLGGNGGNVETSGHYLGLSGTVDASAFIDADGNALGEMGNWLLDPFNVTIANTGTEAPVSGGTYTPNATGQVVKVSSITSALNGGAFSSGTNVTITTGTTGAEAGNITVANAITFGAVNPLLTTGSLVLNAFRDIILNATITSNGLKGGNVSLVAGHDIKLGQDGTNASNATNGVGQGVGSNGIAYNGVDGAISTIVGSITLNAGNNINFGGNAGNGGNGGNGGDALNNTYNGGHGGNGSNGGNGGKGSLSSGSGAITVTAGNDVVLGNTTVGTNGVAGVAGANDGNKTGGAAGTAGIGGTGGIGSITSASGNIKITSTGNTTLNKTSSINAGLGKIDLKAVNAALNGTSTINSGQKLTIDNSGTFFSNTANSLNSVGGVELHQSTAGSIQNAINAVGISGLGGKVILGSGIFDQNFQVVNKGIFTVTGQGAGVTIIKPTALTNGILTSTAPWTSQQYKSIGLMKDNVLSTVSNLTIDGSLLGSGTPFSGLTFYNTSGSISDVNINGGGNATYGLWALSDSGMGHSNNLVLANNVNSKGNKWAGAEVIGDKLTMNILGGSYDGTGGSEGINLSKGSKGTVTNATITAGTNSENAGIALHGAHDYLLTNNTIIGSGAGSTGIYSAAATNEYAASKNVSVIGGSITNVKDGLAANGGANWTIAGGTYTGTGTGVQFKDLTGTNSISGVTLNNFATGISVLNTDNVAASLNFINGSSVNGIYALDSSRLKLTGNQLSNVKGFGVLLDSVSESTLTGNVVTAAAGNLNGGIVSYGFDGSNYTGNTYIANAVTGFQTGMYSGGNGNATYKLNVLNNNEEGIVLAYGSNNSTIEGNFITNSKLGIMSLYGSDNLIKNNVLTGITGDGIAVYRSKNPGVDTSVHVVGNIITAAAGNSGNGVLFDTVVNANVGDGTLLGANLINGFANGVSGIDSSKLSVNGNAITGVSADGIHFTSVSQSDVANNLITAASGNTNGSGIYALGFNGSNYLGNSYTTNAITGFGTGIAAIGNGNALIKNNILLNNKDGIVLAYGSNNSLIEDNLITGSTNGIQSIYASDNTINNNILLGVKGDGISVYGSKGNGWNTNVNVTGNVITAASGNTGNGIKFDSVNYANAGDGTLLGGNAVTGFGKGVSVIASNHVNVNTNLLVNNNTGVFVDPTFNTSVNGNIVLGGSEGIWMLNSDGNSITNNLVSLQSGDGIIVDNSNGTIVTGNFVAPVGGNGVTVRNHSVGTKIAGNTIAGGLNGVYVTGLSHDTYIHNNTAIIGQYNGVYAEDSNGLRVENNPIIGGTTGVTSLGGNNVNITNNGILALQDGVNVGIAQGVNISNNKILALGGDGIQLHDSLGFLIGGNEIGALKTGIHGNNVGLGLIAGNSVISGDNGIDLTNAGLFLIAGNGILAGNNGINLTNTFLGGVVGNDIGALDDGIALNNAQGTVVAGNAILAGGDGIDVYNGSNFTFILGNDVLAVNGDGINIKNSSANVVVGNRIASILGDGVSINGGIGHVVAGNQIAGLYDGVDIRNTALFSVSGNQILSVAGNGVSLENTYFGRVGNNQIAAIFGNGIKLDNSHFTLIDGNAVFAGHDAVNLDNSEATIIGGNALVALHDGVHIKDSNGNVVALNAIAALHDGVNINNGDFNIVAGNAILAGRDGVHLNDSNDNVIALNAIAALHDGVNIHDGDLNIVAGNAILAGRDGVHITDATGNLVTLNAILAGRDGVFFDDADLSAVALNLILSGRDGVHATDSNGLLTVLNVIGAGRDGVNLNNVNYSATGLNLINAARDGVHTQGGQYHLIAGNKVFAGHDGVNMNGTVDSLVLLNEIHANNDGIRGNNLSNTTIIGNDVSGAGRDGVNLSNSNSALVAYNTANGVGRDGFRNNNTSNATYFENTANNNVTGTGFNIINGSNNVTLDSNHMTGNAIGARVENSSNIVFTNNMFTNNTVGARILNTDATTFTGDVFTGNNLGLELNNSDNTVLKNLTIVTAAGGEGIWIRNGSGNTLGEGLNISGINGTGIHLSDAGSDFQFSDGGPAGNFSTFDDNLAYYFVLDNNAMVGQTLDASQQQFAGTFAFDFTPAQLAAAEAKTIDDENKLIVGDVFYKFFPINSRDEEDQKRKGLYRTGLFSYAGHTLNNNVEETPMTFQVSQLGTDLSLLNRTTVAPTTTPGIANFFANLAPAAGGANTGQKAPVNLAQKLAELSPQAGGSKKPLTLAGGCGNTFLDAGANLGFNIGSCQ